MTGTLQGLQKYEYFWTTSCTFCRKTQQKVAADTNYSLAFTNFLWVQLTEQLSENDYKNQNPITFKTTINYD